MTAQQNLSGATDTVSIIIATYNAAQTLERCLQSIFAQTYHAIQVIVIDGASTDGTLDILKQHGENIVWKSEKDAGIYDAMNKGLTLATGQWIYFLGADDELLPAFSDMARELTDARTIYYANVIHKGTKRAGSLTPYYMAKVGVYHQAIIYPKAALANRRYNTRYSVFADYALNMELFGDKRFRFKYKDHIIANYAHTGVSSYKTDEAFERDKSGLILKNFGVRIWLRYKFRKLKESLRGR